jgi:hypothetical protein
MGINTVISVVSDPHVLMFEKFSLPNTGEITPATTTKSATTTTRRTMATTVRDDAERSSACKKAKPSQW